ncbi:hypothetical protein FC63_GL000306 [Lactobacillus amylovorus DSM 20531]|nr:hypothetical protein FC63_GL000306 [Lactobacillus amylovorus DSM 20531]
MKGILEEKPMTIKELLKSNIPRSILIIVLYVLYAFSGSFSQYFLKYALNGITAGKLNTFIYWQAIQGGLEIITALLLPIATVVFTRQTQDYLHQIRQDIMHYYYGSGDAKLTDMQNELTENLKLLTTNYAATWVTILSGILNITIAIALLISMNWILIVTTAILAVITLSLPKIMEKKTSMAMDKVNQEHSKLLNAIEHWLGGLQELRRYTAYGRLARQMQKASGDYVKANKQNYKYQAISEIINGLGNALSQIGMSVVAGVLFLMHIISFGDFAVASSFAFTIFSAIWDITNAITKVKSTKALREQTTELRQKKVNINSKKEDAYGVAVSGLKTKYKEGEEITYPDFTIKKGQKVLLIGDSGTGKSTLFKILLGKLKPEAGQVTFFDQNGQALSLDEAKVGYLPQDPIVFPASIKDNIVMFNEKLTSKVKEVTQAVQLQPDLAKMPAGVDTEVDLKKENLSGGQRQKVVLARSEIHEQPFVLMDEATSAIDQTATEKIIDKLLKTDQTILLIAHNFTPELQSKFDQIIHLKSKKEGAEK